MVKKKQNLVLIVILVVVALVILSSVKKEEPMVEVKYYDENKNLIEMPTGMFSIIGGIPGFTYITFTVKVDNIGDRDLEVQITSATITPSNSQDLYDALDTTPSYDIKPGEDVSFGESDLIYVPQFDGTTQTFTIFVTGIYDYPEAPFNQFTKSGGVTLTIGSEPGGPTTTTTTIPYCEGYGVCISDCCSVSNPCQIYGKDCDTDSECEGSLICVDDVGDLYGCSSTMDVCLPDVPTTNLLQDLISYWSFNNLDARDDHSTNQGTLYGVTSVSSSLGPYAYRFDGINDYIDMGDVSKLDFDVSDSFSISAWIITTADGVVVNKRRYPGTFEEGYGLWVSSGKLYFNLEGVNNEGVAIMGTTTITNNYWRHIVAVRDVGEDKLYIYVDGNLDATPVTDTIVSTLTGTEPFRLGKHNMGGYFNNIIDEVGVWNRALSPSEVSALYDGGSGLLYPFS